MSNLPHQKLRNQYYEEKKTNEEAWKDWEYRDPSIGKWISLTKDPRFYEDIEYRRKLCYIKVNGIKVPKPYRGEMLVGQTYYSLSVRGPEGFFKTHWINSIEDTLIQSRGFLHLEEGSAKIHAKALGFYPEGEE